MHPIRVTSDSATNARLQARVKHAERIPRAIWRLHNIRVIRADRKRKECLWGPGPLHSVEV